MASPDNQDGEADTSGAELPGNAGGREDRTTNEFSIRAAWFVRRCEGRRGTETKEGSKHRENTFHVGPQCFLAELYASVPGRHSPVLTKAADTHIHRQHRPTWSLKTWEHFTPTHPSLASLALEPSPYVPAIAGPTLRSQEPVQGRP